MAEKYKVTLVKRSGEMKYTVHQVLKTKKERWQTLKLTSEVQEEKWVREGGYTREGFVAWCVKMFGQLKGNDVVRQLEMA